MVPNDPGENDAATRGRAGRHQAIAMDTESGSAVSLIHVIARLGVIQLVEWDGEGPGAGAVIGCADGPEAAWDRADAGHVLGGWIVLAGTAT